MLDKRITFIGAGNMAEALISGIISSELVFPQMVTASDIREERSEYLEREYGIKVTSDNLDAVSRSEIIILAVKPQNLDSVFSELNKALGKNQTIISIIAGRKIEGIKKGFGADVAVIRTMPNLPVQVKSGITAIAPGDGVGYDRTKIAIEIFNTVGETVIVHEDMLDAITAVSGSGPGFICLFIEAMMTAAEELDLSSDIVQKLVLSSFAGTLKLIQEKKISPEEVRKRVTSPAGTTEAGVKSFESSGIREIFKKALAASADRSKELAT